MKRKRILWLLAVAAGGALLIGPAQAQVVPTYLINKPDVTVINDETEPVPVIVMQAPKVYEFVGVTTDAVTGGVGHDGMALACQAVYGPEARMATSKEVMESPLIATMTESINEAAWVNPVPVNVVVEPNGDHVAYDISDVRGSTTSTDAVAYLNCDSWYWDLPEITGLVLQHFYARPTPIVAFNAYSCNHTCQVACAAPQ